jgi:3D (Asp-Asp-Asp) domain-containing protein
MSYYRVFLLAAALFLTFVIPAYGQSPYSYDPQAQRLSGIPGYPSTPYLATPALNSSRLNPANACPDSSLTASRGGMHQLQSYRPASAPTYIPMFYHHMNSQSLSPYGQKPQADCQPAKKEQVKALSASPEKAAPPVAKEPKVELLTYQINRGDTLYQISRSFGVDPQVLIDLNGLANPNSLQIGQKLQIPSSPDAPSPSGKSIQRVMTSTLTAYTAGVESTGKTPSHPQYGITFSGKQASEGRTIAVDPKVIPLGSTVYIEGIGVRKAEDTGSAIKGTRIDVFINDVRLARQFGVKKNVKVYVLSEEDI